MCKKTCTVYFTKSSMKSFDHGSRILILLPCVLKQVSVSSSCRQKRRSENRSENCLNWKLPDGTRRRGNGKLADRENRCEKTMLLYMNTCLWRKGLHERWLEHEFQKYWSVNWVSCFKFRTILRRKRKRNRTKTNYQSLSRSGTRMYH